MAQFGPIGLCRCPRTDKTQDHTKTTPNFTKPHQNLAQRFAVDMITGRSSRILSLSDLSLVDMLLIQASPPTKARSGPGCHRQRKKEERRQNIVKILDLRVVDEVKKRKITVKSRNTILYLRPRLLPLDYRKRSRIIKQNNQDRAAFSTYLYTSSRHITPHNLATSHLHTKWLHQHPTLIGHCPR